MQVSVRDVEDEATCGRCSSPWVLGLGLRAGERGHHFFRPAAGRFGGVAGGGLQLLKITFARSGRQSAGRRCRVRGRRRTASPAAEAPSAAWSGMRSASAPANRAAAAASARPLLSAESTSRPAWTRAARPSAASGCAVAEGAVTDYIEDPGGQAGSEGEPHRPQASVAGC
jgi:hypothetical protein